MAFLPWLLGSIMAFRLGNSGVLLVDDTIRLV